MKVRILLVAALFLITGCGSAVTSSDGGSSDSNADSATTTTGPLSDREIALGVGQCRPETIWSADAVIVPFEMSAAQHYADGMWRLENRQVHDVHYIAPTDGEPLDSRVEYQPGERTPLAPDAQFTSAIDEAFSGRSLSQAIDSAVAALEQRPATDFQVVLVRIEDMTSGGVDPDNLPAVIARAKQSGIWIQVLYLGGTPGDKNAPGREKSNQFVRLGQEHGPEFFAANAVQGGTAAGFTSAHKDLLSIIPTIEGQPRWVPCEE